MFTTILAALGWGTVGWLLVAMWDTRYRLRQMEEQTAVLQTDFLAEVQMRYGALRGEE